MSDLISRKALLERLKFKRDTDTNMDGRKRYGLDSAIAQTRKAPAVNAIELPCKIGDTVWCIRNFHGHKHPQEGIVSEMLFTKEMKLLIRVKYVGCGNWGVKIFPTLEEAEAAINKKEKNHE